jgi:hypothetical protein
VILAPDEPSYYALRVCSRAETPLWWASASAVAAGAPAAIRQILAGRTRVELSAQEAEEALAWARGIDGWDTDRLPPVYVYPRPPAGAAAP